jgi:hypothetical protein
MQSVGHRFLVKDVRWIRAVDPEQRRRNGNHPELSTQLYDGRNDRLLRRIGSRDTDAWTAQDVVLIEERAVQHDLELNESLVRHAELESEMQQFYERRPYALGAGAFETTSHRAFRPIGANAPWYPDLVQHSFNSGIRPKPARIIELKKPDT